MSASFPRIVSVSFLSILAASTALVPSVALGAASQNDWTGGDGDWMTVSNWSEGHLPRDGERVIISDNRTVNLSDTVPATGRLGDVYLGNASGSGTLMTSAASIDSGTIFIGTEGEQGTLISNNSQWDIVGSILLGREAGSYGRADFTNNSSVISTGLSYVGTSSTGQMNVLSGSSFSTNSGIIIGSSPGSTGELVVDGAGTEFHSENGLSLGNSGNGTLQLSNGAVLKIDNDNDTGNGYNGWIQMTTDPASVAKLYIGGKTGEAAMAPGTILAGNFNMGGFPGTADVYFNHTSGYYEFAPDVSHAIDITLENGGTALTGDFSGHTGTITVDGGTLLINGDWTGQAFTFTSGGIGGTGTAPTLTAPAGGMTIAPGNSIGTLNVAGDLTLNDNSVFEVEFDDTSADKVIVSGTATVDGKIQYRPATASYTEGTEYTILEAGTLTGSFDEEEIVNSTRLSGLTVTTTIDTAADVVKMKLENGAFEPQTTDRTGTAHSTASYLDSIRGGATGALSDDIDLLAALPTAELDEAMESVSGKRTETVQQVENVYNRAVTGTMKARQLAISGGMIGGTPGAGAPTPTAPTASLTSQKVSFAFADELGVDMPALSGDSLLGLTNNVDGDVPLLETEGDGKSAWLRLFGQFGGEDKDLDKTGYDYTLGGFAGGMDMVINDKLTAGLMLAVGQANVTMDEDTGASDINSYNLGGYGVYDLGDDMFANGLVMLGYNKIDNNRHVVFGATDRQANGDTDSLSLRADVGIGKRFEKNGFEILPTANIGYAMTMQDAYTEQGAGGLNLSYDDQTTQSFLAEVGVEVAKEYKLKGKAFRPYFGLAATLDDPLDDRKINSGFVGASMYSVDGDADTTVGVSPRTGFVLELENGTKVILDYAGDFDRAGETHSFSTGVRFGF